jgi:excisionase family DNA binding protein
LSTNYLQQIDLSQWISQAEAARLRGVSRQAISKLIRKQKLKILEAGGHVLVNRQEVLEYEGEGAGRPISKHEHKRDKAAD